MGQDVAKLRKIPADALLAEARDKRSLFAYHKIHQLKNRLRILAGIGNDTAGRGQLCAYGRKLFLPFRSTAAGLCVEFDKKLV